MTGVRNYVITTVPAPSTQGYALTTLATVKAELGITDASLDTTLGRWINQASRSAAGYCNREFALQGYQDVIRPQQDGCPVTLPNRTAPLMLGVAPVVSITSIATQISTNSDPVPFVAGTDFEFDPGTGEIYRLDSGGNPSDWDAVKTTVIYTAGYTLPGWSAGLNKLLDFAPDLEDAVIRMIRARFFGSDRDPTLKVDTMEGVGTQEFWVPDSPTGNMTPDVQEILDSYRIPVVA